MSLQNRSALEYIDNATKQLKLDVEKMIRINQLQLEGFTEHKDSNDVGTTPNITIRPPISKKGPKQKRKKSILERKNPAKRIGSTQSYGSSSIPIGITPLSSVHHVTIPPTTSYTAATQVHHATIPPTTSYIAPTQVHLEASPYMSYTSMLMRATSFPHCSDEGSQFHHQENESKKNHCWL